MSQETIAAVVLVELPAREPREGASDSLHFGLLELLGRLERAAFLVMGY